MKVILNNIAIEFGVVDPNVYIRVTYPKSIGMWVSITFIT